MSSARSHLPIGLWALALGGTGFAAGFFGPIALNPEANQGPLVGLFITGPGGALSGLVLGAIFRFASFPRAVHAKALLTTCAALALATLYFCLPPPKVLAHVIDAEVAECARPSEFAPQSLKQWEEAAQRATWHTPPANWREVALRNVDADPGLVLTMRIARRATIYEHRKPWDFHRKTISAWASVESPERYYANEEGHDCTDYLAEPRKLYVPFVRAPAQPAEASRVWPPTDVTSFLRLMEIGPVPAEYRDLVSQAE